MTTRNERAGIDDRWHKRVKGPDGTMRTERSAVYGEGFALARQVG
ncbi:hypothetical protein V4U86_05285 [Mycobacterium sp. AMU20-3851]